MVLKRMPFNTYRQKPRKSTITYHYITTVSITAVAVKHRLTR
jgi:hypothetical protein